MWKHSLTLATLTVLVMFLAGALSLQYARVSDAVEFVGTLDSNHSEAVFSTLHVKSTPTC